MYKQLEPEKKTADTVEAQAESQCSCTCKGSVEKDSTETPAIAYATLYDADYYDIGGQ